ncbi:MAG: two component transcriptional regulator, LytTR family [Flavipsychrobacter sp.]|nr:two component transcriptional regulator, LytTR family [Flavipsychrobacter sp.]
MLTCLIIDDEQPCVDTLELILKMKFPELVKVLASTTKPKLAAGLIDTHQPDILFLDVEMPNMTGVELLRSLDHINFQVIFTTAHQQYALDAIKLNALDYLLKPISVGELSVAINKCISRKQQQGSDLVNAFLQQVKPAANTIKRIPIPSNDTTQFVPVNEIIRVESQSNYSNIYFTSRPKLLVARTLKEFEDQLLPFGFIRVHNSHLINLEHVIGYKNVDGGYIIMQGNEVIEISRRKKQEVLQRLNKL